MASDSRQPTVAYITDRPGAHSFGRKSQALARGFTELRVPYDAVFACASGEMRETSEFARDVFLSAPRAALSTGRIAHYLRRTRPSVALVNSGQLGPVAAVAGRITGVPVIPWEATFYDRDLPEMPVRQRVTVILQNLLYKRGPGAIVPSNDLAEWVMQHRGFHSSQIFKVPNPVDVEAVRASVTRVSWESEGPFRMSAVGRLVAQKGWDVLIEALKMASPELPEGWSMTLIGAEVPKMRAAGWGDRVRQLIEDYGLQSHIQIFGRQSNPHEFVAGSHLFVHAARWEPFGNVLTEALALGVPIVATDCPGGPREILDGGRYGCLVPNEDAEALAHALIALAHDPGRRARMAVAAADGVERYRPRYVAAKILDVAEAIGPVGIYGSGRVKVGLRPRA